MRRANSDNGRNNDAGRNIQDLTNIRLSEQNVTGNGSELPEEEAENVFTENDTEFLCDRTVEFMDSGDIRNIVAVELAEKSMYFERLLRYHLGKGVIQLPEFLNSQFSSIVEFVRTGKTKITESNVYSLFIASDFLLVSRLKSQCASYVNKIANNPSVAIKLWVSCRETYWPELGQMAFEKITEHFEAVHKTNEFLELKFEDLKLILIDDSLNCTSEKSVLNAVLTWVSHDQKLREIHSIQLLICVRFNLLSNYELEYMKSCDLVKSTPTILSILESWPNCLKNGFPELLNSSRARFVSPRFPNEAVLVFGGWCEGEGPRAAAQVFDSRANQWTLWSWTSPEFSLLGEIPKRVYAGCVLVDKRIYLVGGFDGHNALKSTLCYDFDIDSGWYEISCMYEKRYYVSVAYALGFIYALGGHNGENQGRLSTAERFNINENLWNTIAPMNRIRSDAAAAELNGRVYICGGFEGRRYHDSGEFYEPETNQWTLINRMMSPRGGVTVVRHDKYLYAIGGNDGSSRLRTIERFDPTISRWEIVGNMTRRKSNLSSTVINDDIYIIGGWSDEPESGILDLVEKFDTKTRQCSVVQPLCFPASATCACTLRDKNIVMKYIRRTSVSLLDNITNTDTDIQPTATMDLVPSSTNIQETEQSAATPSATLTQELSGNNHSHSSHRTE